MQIPIDPQIGQLTDIPYTISFVIRKRIQIDNLNELPKEKRPPEMMIWDGSSTELEDWIDRVYDRKKRKEYDVSEIVILDRDMEN